MKRRLIEDIGAGKAVNDLLNSGLTDPSEIADRINQEPTYTALIKGKGWAGCMAKDVDIYLRDTGLLNIEGDIQSESKALRESPRAQALVSSVQERVNGLIHKAEAAEYILDNTLRDVERLQRRWRQAEDAGEAMEYPTKELTALCRVVETQLKMVSAIKGDEKVQQLIKAGSVNVKQGASQEEVFAAVFGTAEILGHTQQETLDAYSRYMTRSKPIDAEVVNQDADLDD